MRENSVNRDLCDGAAGENFYFPKCLRTVCKGKTALINPIRKKSPAEPAAINHVCIFNVFHRTSLRISREAAEFFFDSLKRDFSDFDAAYSLKRDDSLKWDFEGFAVAFT